MIFSNGKLVTADAVQQDDILATADGDAAVRGVEYHRAHGAYHIFVTCAVAVENCTYYASDRSDLGSAAQVV